MTNNYPERIYLVSPDVEPDEDRGPGMGHEHEGVYWCQDRVHPSDVEYARVTPAPSEAVKGVSTAELTRTLDSQLLRTPKQLDRYRLIEDFANALAAPSHPPATPDEFLASIMRCRYPVSTDINPIGFGWDMPRLREVVGEPAVAVQAEPCPTCGAPCTTEVLMRGGDHGWGTTDKERTVYRFAAHPKPAAQSEGERPCALCGSKARIPPTCDACHDSMGTKPKPAAPAEHIASPSDAPNRCE